MSFAERYGPLAAVTGAESTYGRQFAREAALRGLSLLLIADGDGEAQVGGFAEQLEREHSVSVATATAGDAVNVMSHHDVRLLVSATASASLARGTTEYMMSHGSGGVVLVKNCGEVDALSEELGHTNADCIVLDPVNVGIKLEDDAAGELPTVIKRCLDLLGKKKVYSPKIGESFRATFCKNFQVENLNARLNLLNTDPYRPSPQFIAPNGNGLHT